MSTDPNSEILSSGANFVSKTHRDTYPAIDPTRSNLSGRYVLVTGASKGIGRATALAYAKAGASGIAIAARAQSQPALAALADEIRQAAKALGKPEPKVLSLSLEVTDQKSVDAAAKEVTDAFGGRLDILVNNAGYLETWVPIAESDPDEWWRTWEVNLKGPYLVSRAFLPLLLNTSNGSKTVVNISSVGAHRIKPGASAYQTSKFALLRLTEFLQAEYGSQGLLTFAVHPGGVPTDLAKCMPTEMHAVLTDTPELAGDTIVYLTADRKEWEWLAGRYVSCNWDVEELRAKKGEVERGDLLKVRMAVTSV